MANVTFSSNKAAVLAGVSSATARALEICGGKAESYAKELCPVDTGNLRNSITHQQLDENTEIIGTNVFYATPVELGHHQEPGRYVPAIGKRLKREWVPGKAFIGPAIENHQEEYKAVFIGEFKKIK